MKLNLKKELASLHAMSVGDLRLKYAELFDDRTKTANKPWLIKRIAWRLQALVEGGLSERARSKARELANEADIRILPPKSNAESISEPTVTTTIIPSSAGDSRLPPAGTILTRDYKGRSIQVRILQNGFEWNGEIYRSLSAVAKSVTGSHINGFRFFEL